MTTFEDGPAKGKTLSLRRVPMPMFLRVTIGRDGTVDALDQLDDEPREDERLYAYELSGEQSWVHICSRQRGAGGVFAVANYKLVEDQPSDETMRVYTLWANWATKTGSERT